MMMRGLLTRQASCTVWRSVVAQQRRQGQTAATLTTVQDGTTHTHNTATWMTGAVAVAAAAGGLMWNYSQPATDCCGIVGVVAHPDFDVRCVSLIFLFDRVPGTWNASPLSTAPFLSKYTHREALLEGLTILKNRGYDSAGIATIHHSGKEPLAITKYASIGNNADSIELVRNKSKRIEGHSIGIAHTRWATHGAWEWFGGDKVCCCLLISQTALLSNRWQDGRECPPSHGFVGENCHCP